eukprot:TRINITY_DN414_c0_g1_i1.p1 TRINITY_DN414_c0_g1~~TRINITY_DN414_c0_g1_i1.p1  ORF type:complete len:882 (+),score=415.27 TRINITY_DN414_c0_g1_i1:40-2685(+)
MAAAGSYSGGTPSDERFVLPTRIVPVNYKLRIVPDATTFTFKGEVEIAVEVREETDELAVNAVDLVVDSVHITRGDVKIDIPGSAVEVHPKDERVFMRLPQKLGKGSGTIRFVYSGTINEMNKGFYQAKYAVTGADGKVEQKVLMTTQFEAPDARYALPSWDEPIHKATFDVSIVVDKHLTVLTNALELSTEETGDGKKLVTFEKSPKMSTYLVAFCIGELEYVERVVKKVNSGETTRVRVYTTQGGGKKDRTSLALDIACESLALYEEFFQLDYLMPKLDLIGIPDFAAGAMENWGLVTFRETVLLSDEQSSFRTKLFVALVVAHELAHKWFGNLVTMVWWKELWLNESFATFMEFHAVDVLRPEWQAWSTFVAEDYNHALKLDALQSSHPVEVDVRVAREIGEIFDGISYSKGCSLMRMCASWIGMDNFRTAMRSYVARFQYSNATTADLWHHLEEASKMPVTSVMRQWTSKQGYPVLHVRREGGKIKVRQARFLSTGKPSEETLWQIPVSFGTPQGQEMVLLEGQESEVAVPADAEWVKVNFGQTALVRVAYSDDMLAVLSKAMEEGRLSNVDTTGLINDVAALSEAGLVPATQVLRIAACAAHTEDLTVMTALMSALGVVQHILRDSDEATALSNQFFVKHFAQLGERLGWEHRAEDDSRTRQLRGMVLSRLAGCKHGPSLAEAQRRFAKYMETKDEAVLPSDLRGGVYSAVVKADTTAASWEKLAQVHEAHDTEASEVSRCCVAMSVSRDEEIIKRTLAYSFNKDKTRIQNIAIFMRSLGANAKASDAHFEFLSSHFKEALERLPEMSLTSVMGSLQHPVREEQAVRLEKWWATVDEADRKSTDMAVRQAIENIRIASAFRVRDFDRVVEYLKSAL